MLCCTPPCPTRRTDPLAADSDGDGFDDGVEVAVGTDPNDHKSFPASVPLLGPWGLGVLIALLFSVSGLVRRRAIPG
ncbi:MAG: hypothetical protein JRG90_10555 [Deltaproteobacteria bacterium]|nr:hypothetical protein [Deltaproteobacteria bacterium]